MQKLPQGSDHHNPKSLPSDDHNDDDNASVEEILLTNRLSVALLMAFVWFAPRAEARDAYLVRFSSFRAGGSCESLQWNDRVAFFNRGSSPATVRILGISDGTTPLAKPETFVVGSAKLVVLDDVLKGAWRPGSFSDSEWLFVMHLDVPEGITVDSRDEFYLRRDCIGPPLNARGPAGHATMPVFDHLTPAGVPHIHLGTDLGIKQTRTNVIVFNAGSSFATARIELRRQCDDAIVDQVSVSIPTNSTVQVAGRLNAGERFGGCRFSGRYTTVTMDQPGLSVVSNVTMSTSVSGTVPTVDLTVSHSHDF